MTLTNKQKMDRALAKAREEGAAEERARIAEERGTNADLTGGVSQGVADANMAAVTRPDLVASAHGERMQPSYAGDKVVVGCKLGVSWYQLQLFRMEQKFQQDTHGGRMVTEAVRIGGIVQLRGTSYPRGTPPRGFPPPPETADGAALTRGVSRDFMETWLEQNRLNPIVQNRLIFIAGSDDEARGIAADLAGIRSGLEPLNPDGDARISAHAKSTRPEIEDTSPAARG